MLISPQQIAFRSPTRSLSGVILVTTFAGSYRVIIFNGTLFIYEMTISVNDALPLTTTNNLPRH